MTSPTTPDEMRTAPQWDAFISHAWEDKESFVRPLAHALTALGAAVWYDEFSLKLGDSLSASIDRGLAGSRYGIVVLSKAFIAKPWPQRELQGLVAREMGGRSTILPVWHQLTRDDVLEFSAPLADRLAAITANNTADQIALQILSVIRPDIAGNTPYDDLRRIAVNLRRFSGDGREGYTFIHRGISEGPLGEPSPIDPGGPESTGELASEKPIE